MQHLTLRQDQILSFIESQATKGQTPTYREIQTHFGFASPKAVVDHVQALVQKGHVKRRRSSRGIMSLRPQPNEVPLLGRIAAGAPIEAIENIESTLDLVSLGIDNRKGNYFALRVKGDSMINAHILDGDIVVIQKQPVVNSNEIAAVLWNNEATLKYVKQAGTNVLLVPANDALASTIVTSEKTESFCVLGKVVRIIRSV